ncbi:hypothetical protein CPB97_004799 [Podila verticillata]|nr:hypothetical protein CPB97_004799 [Podila verticillata]
MRKPLSAGLQGGLSRSLQSLSLQQDRHIQQAWDAVIRFSARHLYCPAHSPTNTPVGSSIHSRALTGSRPYHLNRHRRPQPGSVDLSDISGHRQIRNFNQIRTLQPSRRQARFGTIPTHRSTSPITTNTVRHASTAALPIPPLSEDTPSQLTKRCPEPTSLSSTATPSPNQEPTPASHATPTPKSGSWRFPLQDAAQLSSRSVSPIQSWPSTSKALSTFYGSLHLARSPPSRHSGSTSPSTSSSPLHLAILNYNYLSKLQGLFDTVLVPRRDTRLLFLMQGREPKTEENLEQLLRIASDLIWLDQKGMRRRKWTERKEEGAVVVEEEAFEDNRSAEDGVRFKPALSKIKDEFHGLRVSEYTVLMNWIGAVEPKPVSSKRSTRTDQQQHKNIKPTEPTRSPILPVDRTWAIWQDFLRTGMKPDVVMYTALMDRLLKAKQVEQADEIWQHMLHHQASSLSTTGSPKHSPTTTISNKQMDLKRTKSQKGVVPNLQTFSVLMQNHVANRDLEGVVQTYKGLVATSDSGSVPLSSPSSSSPPSNPSLGHHVTTTSNGSSTNTTALHETLSPITMANTVLLNQILAALIDLGESKAAYDIFVEMQSTCRSSSAVVPPQTAREVSGGSLSPTPIHHQSFRRRIKGHKDTEKDDMSPTIQPDIRTYRLMLKLARRERDRGLEKEILSYMMKPSGAK